ncbi:MAG: hypothetical protein HY865_09570 [Chloroflexi bacterium]|nr:hypothetical protein [Chloroflexota bacterium]
MTSGMEGYIGLLIQVPLVGIFVWFALSLIRIFTENIERRDKAWQEFIEQQRKANADSIAHMAQRFADEIRSIGKEVSELRGALEK